MLSPLLKEITVTAKLETKSTEDLEAIVKTSREALANTLVLSTLVEVGDDVILTRARSVIRGLRDDALDVLAARLVTQV